MKITISPQVFSCYPELHLAFLYLKKIDNKRKLSESRHLFHDLRELTHLTFQKHNLLSPQAVARQDYGKEARHYHTSVEKLLQEILKRKRIAASDTLTNLLHVTMLQYLLPVGADDAQKITGDIAFALQDNQIYYHDQERVLGTKLDFWKNAQTALTPASTSALIHLEFLPPHGKEELQEILQKTKELLLNFCGGTATTLILHRRKSQARLP